MKTNYLITIFAILLISLTACATIETNVVEELPEATEESEVVVISEGESSEGSVVEESGSVEEDSEETNVSVLIEQAYADAGLIDNSSADEEEEETTNKTIKDVSIEYFKGVPEDFSISVGTTVRWTNNMDNYRHIVIIMPWLEDEGKFSNVWMNDLEELLVNEVYEYTFDEAGSYKWGSKTKYEKVKGDITVS